VNEGGTSSVVTCAHYPTTKMGDVHNPNTNSSGRCVNNCGFFGTPDTGNMCSKCYKDLQKQTNKRKEPETSCEEPNTKQQKVQQDGKNDNTSDTSSNSVVPNVIPSDREINRCHKCNIKLSLTAIKCRCGFKFCIKHRYDKEHDCTFDWKNLGKKK